ncbi:MAG: cytochrome c [Myxococcales bacterium]|nr:cytochrome c [Myxococcales bacterium]
MRCRSNRFEQSSWILAAGLAVAVLSGCDKEPPRSEWTPADHRHPPESAVDPARVPAGSASKDPTIDAARALWRVTCASCHGVGGDGTGAGRPPGVTLANFADPAWQKTRTDGDLAAAIRDGRGLMPKFGDQINPTGIAALVAHIRSFDPTKADQAPKPESAGDAP